GGGGRLQPHGGRGHRGDLPVADLAVAAQRRDARRHRPSRHARAGGADRRRGDRQALRRGPRRTRRGAGAVHGGGGRRRLRRVPHAARVRTDAVMADIAALAARLRAELSAEQVLSDRQELRTYECDGLAHYKVIPALAVFPHTGEQCGLIVRACGDFGVPFVARGSGTGLSGGALPHADGVLIVTSQMRQILEVAPQDERAVVEPGVLNLQVTKAASPHGYYY